MGWQDAPEVGGWESAPVVDEEKPDTRSWQQRIMQNAAAGLVRGAGSIGATLMAPKDMLDDYFMKDRGKTLSSLVTGEEKPTRNQERRQGMDAALSGMGADPESLAFGAAKLTGEVMGTAGAGPALAGLGRAVPALSRAAPGVLDSIATAGFKAGGLTGLPGVASRVAGGAITGGASAGLVNPESAGAGAAIGGILPPLVQGAGLIGKGIVSIARGGSVSPEVAALARRAKDLGIRIPADRLVNSKPLDAIASGLNYVPFSGRAATEAGMASDLNRVGSQLMGQNTTNMNKALRDAGADLGAKFDSTLKTHGVVFDQQLLQDAADVFNVAQRELGADALKAISSQVDELTAKGATGVIDGQAAYNIKRTLDRIGRRPGPEAWHALELKGKLMNALNRSLGPQEAAAFAKTREQYSNMLALEKLAKNGVEGEISVARLANLQNINNQPLQELADIAAQFVKPREAQHGAMQRALVALGIGGTTGPIGLAGAMGAGRAANTALNSQWAKNTMLGVPSSNGLLGNEFQQGLLRIGPLLGDGL